MTSRQEMNTVTSKCNLWWVTYNGARLTQSLHVGNITGFAVCNALNVKLGCRVFVGELHNTPVAGADHEQSDRNVVNLKTILNYCLEQLLMHVDVTGIGDAWCSK